MHRGSYPEGLTGKLKVSQMTEDEYSEAQLKLLFGIRQECIRQNRLLFDHSHPVDEYYCAPDAVNAGDFEIQPDYAMPVRIEGIFASLPIGTTKAVLSLGRERQIILYQGSGATPATTAQTLISIPYGGTVLTDNDRRILTLTGSLTSGFFIQLTGHALERYGNK